jgi:2-methylcitrate dehydratase PrpD
MDPGELLCAQVAAWRYEQLPPQVVRTAKGLLLDTLGVIAGAARAAGIPELNARLARWEAGGSATGLIGKRRYSPPSAALANGTAAHALDYDDIHDEARVHSCCVVLPAVLAAAEDAGGVSGKDLLLALVTGVELHARLGLACSRSLAIGWHPTAIFGAMAGAVAAGRVLGLDAGRLRHALGIAFHQASGSAQSAYDGALAKRLGAGFAARDAVTSAFLAADGLTGPRALDGKAGFFALHMRGEVSPGLLTGELGSRWRIEEYSLKPYPACRCSHSAIGIGVRLHRDGVAAEAVASAEIRLSEANWALVGKPYDAALDSVVHAQFSAAYSFARALVDGKVGPLAYERPAIGDPHIAALAARIRVLADPAIPKDAMEPVQVDLKLKDGRSLALQADTIKGSRQEPMSDGELLDKLRGCLEFGLDAPPAAADRLAELVFDLETLPNPARSIVEVFPSPP